jgi:hypothetical protein
MTVYTGAMNAIKKALIGNLPTIRNQADTLDYITAATDGLQFQWFTDTMKTSGTGVSSTEISIATEINRIKSLPVTTDQNKKDKLKAISDLTKNFMTADNVDLFSNGAILDVMGQLNTCFDSENGPPVLGFLSSYQSLISAQSGKELSVGQSLIKSQGSIIQQSSSNQQALADIGPSILALFGSISTFLSESIF